MPVARPTHSMARLLATARPIGARGVAPTTVGIAVELITNRRSFLNRKPTLAPSTGAPSWCCANATVRIGRLPWRPPCTVLVMSFQSVSWVPGAISASCSASRPHAAVAARSADPLAPGDAMPSPQMRSGTPVAASQVASHAPWLPTNAFHAGLAPRGATSTVWRSLRSEAPSATSTGRSALRISWLGAAMCGRAAASENAEPARTSARVPCTTGERVMSTSVVGV